jgi:hypothetical protein
MAWSRSVLELAPVFVIALPRPQNVLLLHLLPVLTHLLRHLLRPVLLRHRRLTRHYRLPVPASPISYTVLVVVLTDLEVPPPPKPPLLKLLEKPLLKPPPKKSSLSNMLLPKPKEPKLPKRPPPCFLVKKLLKKGSSSNSWLLKNFEKRSSASWGLKWRKEEARGPSKP